VNLRGAVGALDFDVLKGKPRRLLAALGRLILPPQKTATD
jgi:hypothetical protein